MIVSLQPLHNPPTFPTLDIRENSGGHGPNESFSSRLARRQSLFLEMRFRKEVYQLQLLEIAKGSHNSGQFK
jgi:hypothetical protein